jgi:hypothetical protein
MLLLYYDGFTVSLSLVGAVCQSTAATTCVVHSLKVTGMGQVGFRRHVLCYGLTHVVSSASTQHISSGRFGPGRCISRRAALLWAGRFALRCGLVTHEPCGASAAMLVRTQLACSSSSSVL